MEFGLEVSKHAPTAASYQVSILVVMEFGLEVVFTSYGIKTLQKFQSLL